MIINEFSFRIAIDDFHENQKNLCPLLCSISIVGLQGNCAYPNLEEIVFSGSSLLVSLLEKVFTDNPTMKVFFYLSFLERQPLNKIGQYKKIWKNNMIPESLVNDTRCLCSAEVELRNDLGVFGYAGLMNIPLDKIPVALEKVRMDSRCAVFISDDKHFFTGKNIEKILHHREPRENEIFPHSEIDWIKLGEKCCNEHTIIIRASGCFDDHDAGVDILGIRSSVLYNAMLRKLSAIN